MGQFYDIKILTWGIKQNKVIIHPSSSMRFRLFYSPSFGAKLEFEYTSKLAYNY